MDNNTPKTEAEEKKTSVKDKNPPKTSAKAGGKIAAAKKSAAASSSKTVKVKKPAAKKSAVKRSPLRVTAADLDDEYGLKLFFQPVYVPKENRLFGYECLLRIIDRELGIITPDLFIGVARKNPSLMRRLEDWAIAELFRTSKLFADNKRYVEMLSLNIDTVHFFSRDFYERVSRYFEKITENIYFELKEDVFFSQDKEVTETLEKLRSAGIKIAVDDFTANILTFDFGEKLPFDMIKIERTYIDRFLVSPKARLIVEKIVEFAKRHKVDLVAVGVESAEQEKVLTELGCEKLQGYYYSKPVPAKNLF